MELKRERLVADTERGIVDRMDRDEDEGVSPPPSKRTHHESDESPEPVITGGTATAVLASVAATNIKITSQGNN